MNYFSRITMDSKNTDKPLVVLCVMAREYVNPSNNLTWNVSPIKTWKGRYLIVNGAAKRASGDSTKLDERKPSVEFWYRI